MGVTNLTLLLKMLMFLQKTVNLLRFALTLMLLVANLANSK